MFMRGNYNISYFLLYVLIEIEYSTLSRKKNIYLLIILPVKRDRILNTNA